MKRKFFLLALAGALAVLMAGCVTTGPYGGYPSTWGGHQNFPADESLTTKSVVTKYVPGGVVWRSTATPTHNHTINIGARPVAPQTVKSLEEALAENPKKRAIFQTEERLFVDDMKDADGKKVSGYIPVGKLVLMEKIAETDEYTEWQSIFVAHCGNPTKRIHRYQFHASVEKTAVQTQIRTQVQQIPVLVPSPPVYGSVILIDPAWAVTSVVADVITNAIFGPPRWHHPPRHYLPGWGPPPIIGGPHPQHHYPGWSPGGPQQPRWPQPRGPFCPNGWNGRR